jgi:acetyltransferase
VCPSVAAAEALCAALPEPRASLLLASWVGGEGAERARDQFSEAGVPCFPTPEQAIQAYMHVVDYQRGQRALMQTPESMPEPRTAASSEAAPRLRRALQDGAQWLNPADTRAVLAAYGFRVLTAEHAANAEQAAGIAERLGVPVALKIVSPDIVHKTDVGGVALDLRGARVTRAAARAMVAAIRERLPAARLQGFLVEPMARREGALELLLGMSTDPQFGPILVFGHGGTATETIADRALALPPLNLQLAREMISRTRVARLLRGARGLGTIDVDVVALSLVQLSELVCDLPEVAELDINPLLARPEDCTVIDARIRIAPATAPGSARLAIKPYPRELESEVPLADGRRLLLRPVRPEDEPALVRAFGTLTPEEVYLRFFAPLKTMSHLMGARFTQIDYDRQMTFILTERGAPGTTPYYGSVNLICDPDMQRAEYAILVHHDMAGRGLGRLLMQRIIDYARSRGIHEITGDVLAQNAPMLNLCRSLGFALHHNPADPAVVRVQLAL